MKSEPINAQAGAFYTGAANEQPVNSPQPAPQPPPMSRREPSPDRHGAMATQLRDSLRGSPQAGSASHPSPTTSVRSADLGPLEPTSLEQYIKALDDIEKKAVDYLQQHRQARQQLLQSWPSVMTFAQVEETFQHHWQEAMDQAGYQALSSQKLSGDEKDQADADESRMTERVGDLVIQELAQQGWFMNPRPDGLKWGAGSPLTLLKNGDFASVQPDSAVREKAGEHGAVRFLSTPLRQVTDGASAHAGLALKVPHGDGWQTAHHELEGYRTIIAEAGLHPNLMVALGEARTNNVSGLLFMAVPGGVGDRFLGALKQARQQQKISASESEQVLALLLHRGLSVIDHCRRASVCISDMKPANFIVDERSGEPIFYDLGLWTRENEVVTGSTRRYAPPEANEDQGDVVDHRSDMFGLVASLSEAIGGGEPMFRKSGESKVNVMPNLIDADEQDVEANIRHPADARETPLWQLAARLMYQGMDGQRNMRKDDRMSMQDALEQVTLLRAGHDEAHVLEIMKRLSRDASTAGAGPST